MAAQLYLPRITRIGAGCRNDLPDVLLELGVSKPLLVSDPFMLEIGVLGEIADILRVAGFNCGIFSDSVPDPTTDNKTGIPSIKSQR